jgi:hypothetical protein
MEALFLRFMEPSIVEPDSWSYLYGGCFMEALFTEPASWSLHVEALFMKDRAAHGR